MRISFSGTANSGKSTLVNAFLRKWQMYVTPQKTYRDVIKENNLTHSSTTTEDTQLLILDWMLQEHEKWGNDTNVVFDRCSWDNLAYTLLANSKDQIRDEVTAAVISLVRESLKNVDIIFWVKKPKGIKLVNDVLRDVNEEYINQIEKVFEDLFEQYSTDLESDIFYPKEDCPAIIQVEGDTVDDRLFYISQFINRDGKLIIDENSILDPKNVNLIEDMIKQQRHQKEQDAIITNMVSKISQFTL